MLINEHGIEILTHYSAQKSFSQKSEGENTPTQMTYKLHNQKAVCINWFRGQGSYASLSGKKKLTQMNLWFI